MGTVAWPRCAMPHMNTPRFHRKHPSRSVSAQAPCRSIAGVSAGSLLPASTRLEFLERCELFCMHIHQGPLQLRSAIAVYEAVSSRVHAEHAVHNAQHSATKHAVLHSTEVLHKIWALGKSYERDRPDP